MSEQIIPDWKKKYCIGIDEVDYQHKYFLELIHRMDKKVRNGMEKTLVQRHLNEVVKYAQFHFFSEENLMLIHDYPEFKKHHELHEDLLDSLATKVNYFAAGGSHIVHVIDFMVHWFIDHTLGEDLKFAKYLKTNQ